VEVVRISFWSTAAVRIREGQFFTFPISFSFSYQQSDIPSRAVFVAGMPGWWFPWFVINKPNDSGNLNGRPSGMELSWSTRPNYTSEPFHSLLLLDERTIEVHCHNTGNRLDHQIPLSMSCCSPVPAPLFCGNFWDGIWSWLLQWG